MSLDNRIIALFLGVCLASAQAIASAEVAIVVHPNNPTEILSKTELARLYLGRSKQFPDGSTAHALNQTGDSATRQEMEQHFLGRNATQMKAYWAKAMFSGSATPPAEVADDAAVKAAVAADETAVGYIDAASVDDSVKVVQVQ